MLFAIITSIFIAVCVGMLAWIVYKEHEATQMAMVREFSWSR